MLKRLAATATSASSSWTDLPGASARPASSKDGIGGTVTVLAQIKGRVLMVRSASHLFTGPKGLAKLIRPATCLEGNIAQKKEARVVVANLSAEV